MYFFSLSLIIVIFGGVGWGGLGGWIKPFYLLAFCVSLKFKLSANAFELSLVFVNRFISHQTCLCCNVHYFDHKFRRINGGPSVEAFIIILALVLSFVFGICHTHTPGFPQLLKNHWNSDLFQDHGKIIELHEKFLKFVKMRKSWKNHWILDQLLMEKSLNSEIDIVLTNYICK